MAHAMSTARSKRLTRDAWLEAGIEALRSEGNQALKAEPMARFMKTTKGSFYWHFKDVTDFHAALLKVWETAAVTDMTHIAEQNSGEVACLRAIAQSLADPKGGDPVLLCEPAIRGWAANNENAEDALERVDAMRLTALAGLLKNIGIGNPEVPHMLYSAAIGMSVLARQEQSEKTEAIGSLVDLILALR
jgi:AcrR family transcriptional regulator